MAGSGGAAAPLVLYHWTQSFSSQKVRAAGRGLGAAAAVGKAGASRFASPEGWLRDGRGLQAEWKGVEVRVCRGCPWSSLGMSRAECRAWHAEQEPACREELDCACCILICCITESWNGLG